MNIIKKCLDELAKDNFRKDYVIGLLESYHEMNVPTHNSITSSQIQTPPIITFIDPQKNEEIIPDFLKVGPVVDTRNGAKSF